jgi:hypothetical protein
MQLLRRDWYMEEQDAANRDEATPLWRALMPRPVKAE